MNAQDALWKAHASLDEAVSRARDRFGIMLPSNLGTVEHSSPPIPLLMSLENAGGALNGFTADSGEVLVLKICDQKLSDDQHWTMLENLFASARSRGLVVAYSETGAQIRTDLLEVLKAAGWGNLIVLDGSSKEDKIAVKITEYISEQAPLVRQLQSVCIQLRIAEKCKARVADIRLRAEFSQKLFKRADTRKVKSSLSAREESQRESTSSLADDLKLLTKQTTERGGLIYKAADDWIGSLLILAPAAQSDGAHTGVEATTIPPLFVEELSAKMTYAASELARLLWLREQQVQTSN